MARNTKQRQPDRETVDDGEEDLRADDGVDEAGEDFAREHGVLFDQLGEVVESGCCGG